MSDGKRILVVDDTGLLSRALSEHLEKSDVYSCVIETNPEKGLERALKCYFDLIVLDVNESCVSHTHICRTLRANGIAAPIMTVVSNQCDIGTIQDLDAGASDCICKPFKFGVLMARIRAQIRQFEHSEEAQLNVGRFVFNGGAKTLLFQEAGTDEIIRLTDKEAQIIKFLYLHRDRLVSREELLGEVWGYNAGISTHTLETHVYRLRQKMETDPSEVKILVTEPGGYRLRPEG
ncbi:MAG: response regulator transcription factor [Magnetovibrio sp.]|nr:response regulator transcription factor [Magnetovibrio sp.]